MVSKNICLNVVNDGVSRQFAHQTPGKLRENIFNLQVNEPNLEIRRSFFHGTN